jgi:hypothetical protein
VAIFGRTSRPVVGVGTAGPGAEWRLDWRSPSFGQQYLGVVRRQVHYIADASIRQIDPVDDLCQLLGQPNLHTRSISTNVRRA